MDTNIMQKIDSAKEKTIYFSIVFSLRIEQGQEPLPKRPAFAPVLRGQVRT